MVSPENRGGVVCPERIREFSSFIVMDVLEKANEMEQRGIHVIHLEVGEPDFQTPGVILDSAARAIADGITNYTHSQGTYELRCAICDHYMKEYGVTLDPGNLIVTSGTSPAILLAFSVAIEQDDEVILTDPHYACYPNFVRYLGAKPVFVPLSGADGFMIDPDRVRKAVTSKTKAVMINSPANPTGAVIDKERLQKLAETGLLVFSDEIYHGLEYGKKSHSILEFTRNAVVFNGFSKRYAMTGMRLGYVIAPENMIRPMQKLQQNFFISANAAMQVAGITALKSADADVERMKKVYAKRRRFMIDRLREIGFRIPVEPDGAFYVFADATEFSADSYSLAFDILENAHVGVTPGIDFGKNGEGYIRFSYATSMENIAEGLNRIEAYLRG